MIARLQWVESTQIDRRTRQVTKNRGAKCPMLATPCSISLACGVRAKEHAGGKRPDNHGRAHGVGGPSQSQSQDQGGDRGGAGQIDVARDAESRRNDEHTDRQCAEQKTEGGRRDAGDLWQGDLGDQAMPATTVRMISPMMSSMTATAPNTIWLSGSPRRPDRIARGP